MLTSSFLKKERCYEPSHFYTSPRWSPIIYFVDVVIYYLTRGIGLNALVIYLIRVRLLLDGDVRLLFVSKNY